MRLGPSSLPKGRFGRGQGQSSKRLVGCRSKQTAQLIRLESDGLSPVSTPEQVNFTTRETDPPPSTGSKETVFRLFPDQNKLHLTRGTSRRCNGDVQTLPLRGRPARQDDVTRLVGQPKVRFVLESCGLSGSRTCGHCHCGNPRPSPFLPGHLSPQTTLLNLLVAYPKSSKKRLHQSKF